MSADRSSVSLHRQPRVAIIGRSQPGESSDLVVWLRESPAVTLVGEFTTIADVCSDGSAEPLPFDFVIVLQSTSDEYTAADASQLIGRMLFGRVLCCYSPWCQSDGRSHDVWPVSTRIPVSTARTVLAGELIGFRTDRPALLPLSAAEEVFAHRVLTQSWSQTSKTFQRLILILSDELALRDTVLKMCGQLELIAVAAAMDIESATAAIQRLRRDLSDIRRLEVLVDLDPLHSKCLDLLAYLKDGVAGASNSEINVLGMTVFPESSFSRSLMIQANLTAVIDKTELLIRLTDELGDVG